jgi:hypothetical protein
MPSYSLYLHIPFCLHRCGYCDFNTYAGLEELIPAYARALRREIEFTARAAGERLPVHTVFFGGGTPSLLPAGELAAILERCHRLRLAPDIESPWRPAPSRWPISRFACMGVPAEPGDAVPPRRAAPARTPARLPDVIRAVTWAPGGLR